MRLTLSILAVFSVMSVGVLGNFYQITQPRVGTSVISPKMEKQMGGNELTFSLPSSLTEKQHHLLDFAYSIAKKVGLKSPEIAQGIIFQESKAGGMDSYKVAGQEFGLKTNERYYGVGQIKLPATKAVLQKFPYLWDKYDFHTRTDEEIIANLIMNDLFNVEVATLYLKILSSDFGYEGDRLTAAYNKGPGGVRSVSDPSSLNYVVQVHNHIKNKIKNIK